MSDNEKQTIKGTNGNDHINPEGYGTIDTGKGNDTVVISEGDFFAIKGIDGTDSPNITKADAEKISKTQEVIYKQKLDLGQDDQLKIFIDPEKEQTQSVQYFVRGGSTYVQIYDKELDKVVAGARVEGTDFEIQVVGENGSLGVKPTKLDYPKIGDNLANNINEGIAKGEISSDISLKGKIEDFVEKKVDQAKSSWNPLDNLAAKYYEAQQENKER